MSFFETLQSSSIAQFVIGGNHLVEATFQIIHVVGILLVLTAVLLIGLRLLGLGLHEQSLAAVQKMAQPFLWLGLAAAIISGSMLFVSTAVIYAAKTVLQIKLVLLVMAVVLQFGLVRRLVTHPVSNAVARGAALASLTLWFGVGLAGRAIGFT
jgi:hypothetical protein